MEKIFDWMDRVEESCRRRNETFKARLCRFSPPGYEMAGEYRFFWIWLIFGVVYSMQFLVRYINAYGRLFYYIDSSTRERVLDTRRQMTDFGELIDGVFVGLYLGVFCLVFAFWRHYSYYRKESKSIYLMKRLQDRSLLYKTYYWTPLHYGVILIGTVLVLLALYFGIYIWVTPEACLRWQ